MGKVIIFCISISFFLAACHRDGEYRNIYNDEFVTKIYAKCPPRKIEIGLHFDDPVPSKYNDVPINLLPFNSGVIIYDAEKKKLLQHKEMDSPFIYWMSDKNTELVEYIGLQEVVLPAGISCKDYIIEVHIKNFPEWLGRSPSESEVYVRKSKRP